jgi:hypothetical protein
MKEALKLALEALEGLYISSFTMPNSPISIAITAIKAALAQPVQQEHDVDATIIQYHEATIKRLEKRIEDLAQPAHVISEQEQLKQWIEMTKYYRAKREYEPDAAQPAQQEPVAWLDEEKKIIYWHNTHETDDYHGFKRSTPLYTTPQQRPWVGLTHQDISNELISDEVDYVQGFLQGARWADALLEEKNT